MKKLLLIIGCVLVVVLTFLIYTLFQPVKLGDNKREAIHEYLDHNIITPGFGGQMFSSFRVLKKGKEHIYLWAHIQEYYNGKLGTATSLPVALTIRETNEQLEILTHEVPGSGLDYPEDIKRIFPRIIHGRIRRFPATSTVKQMEEECRDRWQKSIDHN